MAFRRNVYPRTWDGGSPPELPYFGSRDIAVFAGFKADSAKRWMTDGKLPPADGPDINGAPTWSRELVLVWLFMRNSVPSRAFAEAQAIVTGPRGQELLELAAIGALA